jgi:DNA-directed RNA polymerase I, II, and III subunit RPABC2
MESKGVHSKGMESKEVRIVMPEKRITHDYMSSFEYCEAVSIRARHIENGSTTFVPIEPGDDPISIAKREIAEKKCPLKIRRMLTSTTAEEWDVNELHTKSDTY